MKIIIVGAGELGQLLAVRLCRDNHDVTVIDSSSAEFDRLREKLDLMVVEGSATDVSVLLAAGIERADMFLAVSGNESDNIVACKLASHFGVKRTICRLYSACSFAEGSGVKPEMFGIWRPLAAPAECARKVLDAVRRRTVLEKILFSNPKAVMDVISVEQSSLIAGLRIKDIPCSDRLSDIRFAALIRDTQLLIPHGDTIIVPGDKLYVAGTQENVFAFMEWAAGDDIPVRRVVISGASVTGTVIAESLLREKFEVRIIESNLKLAEKIQDTLDADELVFHGDVTDQSMLEEAGVGGCDVFVAASDDDESNILSCIMAKNMGAEKVLAVTHKPEYISMVPAMNVIDCGFNTSLVSVNTIFRLMETGTCRIDAQLQRYNAYLTEFKISKKSRLCGRSILESKLPPSAIFAMIFRHSEVISPSGNTVFEPGDTVVAIVTPEIAEQIEPYFIG